MKNRIVMSAILFGSLLVLVGCANVNQENRPQTNLTKTEVLRIAEATAKSEGYDVGKYNMTGCHYEFTDKDNTWTVFYELKPPTPPGGHFLILVDDGTKAATLAHGE